MPVFFLKKITFVAKNMAIDFKKYFTFRKVDRIGIIALIIVIAALFSVNLTLPKLTKTEQKFDTTKFVAQIDTFVASLTPKEEKEYISRLDSFIIARYDTLELFMFDPNTTTDEEWHKLGLTNKQIKTINTYKDRGGKFFIKDDFRKIYGIRTKQYQILKPYINLPDKLPEDTKKSNLTEPKNITLFEFDPNTASADELLQLGLTDRQVSTIVNYRNKGGKFYKKEDFKKIYTISEDDYNRLSPYIKISRQERQQAQISIIEINSADTSQLKTLPGIGDVLASRIVKFRKKLGGFYSIEQLKEVYGLKPETFDKIKQYLTINTSTITKININTATYKQLTAHPYINSLTANNILNFRKNNGNFTDANQLVINELVTQEVYDKIKNYISVE